MVLSGSNPFTSQAKRTGKVDASNFVMPAAPDTPVLQGAPSRRHVVAERRDGTETGDDDPTSHYAPTLVFR